MANGAPPIVDAFTGFSPLAGLGAGFVQAQQGVTDVLRDLATLNIRQRQAQQLQQNQIRAAAEAQARQIAASQAINQQRLEAAERDQARQAELTIARQLGEQQFRREQQERSRQTQLDVAQAQKAPRPPTAREKSQLFGEAFDLAAAFGLDPRAKDNLKLVREFSKSQDPKAFDPVFEAVEGIQEEAPILFEPDESRAFKAFRRKLSRDQRGQLDALRQQAQVDPIGARKSAMQFLSTIRKQEVEMEDVTGDPGIISRIGSAISGAFQSLPGPRAVEPDALLQALRNR